MRLSTRKCGCPHGCDRACDSLGRCPYCHNGGRGCPDFFKPNPKHKIPAMLLAAIFAVTILSACGNGDTIPMATAVAIEDTPAPEGVKVPSGILHCPVCLETDLEQVGEIHEWTTGESNFRAYWDTEGELIFGGSKDTHQWINYRCVNDHLFHTSCNIPHPHCVALLGSWEDR